MILANGVDAISIGPLGATLSRHDQASMVLPHPMSLGWFKTGRKYFASHATAGSSLCLVEPRVFFFLGQEQFMPYKAEQVFNPRTTTLTTTFGIHDNRGAGCVRMEVETFLTHAHLLVERFRVLESPVTPLHLEFSLALPFDAGSCFMDHPVRAQAVRHKRLTDVAGMLFTYRLCDYHGVCAAWHDGVPLESRQDAGAHRRIISPTLRAGDCLTHYVAVLDNQDDDHPCRAMSALVEQTRRQGYARIRRAHRVEWRRYFNRSTVNLPAGDIQHLYDTSLYVLRSVYDADMGFMPMGIVPFHWQNAMFWDSWFGAMAWLGCNHQTEVRGILAFWKKRLPEARALARKLKCAGARFGWTSNRKEFTRDKARVLQFHNNAMVALMVAQVWVATGDVKFLREHLVVMEESLQFLIARLVRTRGDAVDLRACAGPDESVLDLKNTDTWTCALLVKALDAYLAATQTLGRVPFQPGLPRLRQLLWRAMNSNVDEQGVLQSFQGGMQPHWGSLIFMLFPDHPARVPTLRALSRYDRELDGYNSHGIIHYPARVFTWAEYWVIRILAEAGDRSAWTRLQKNAKFTNMFGGIPERLFMNGELFINWFMTAHAACLWAMHALLLRRVDDTLWVLCGLPATWRTVSFKNLTTADGLRVSAAMRKGGLTHLCVVNDHAKPRRVCLRAAGLRTAPFVLQSGKRWTWRQSK